MPPASSIPIQVLIVDDEVTDRMLMEALIKRALPEAVIVFAESCAQCASVLADTLSPFDIVFLDMILPDGRAEQIWESIVEHSPNASITLTSGLDQEQLSSLSADMPYDDYLAKPLDLTTMKLHVANLAHSVAERRSRDT